MIEAYALVWPVDGDNDYLLYRSRREVEDDQKWFSKNFKNNSADKPRGEPKIVKLCACEDQSHG